MKRFTFKRLALVLLGSLAAVYVLWMWALYAFGEPPPLGVTVVNETSDALVVQLGGSDYEYPVSPNQTEYILLDNHHDPGNFIEFLVSPLTSHPPTVPDHIGQVRIAARGGRTVWSGDLRDHPEFAGERDWWMGVQDDGGEMTVSPRIP